MTDPIRRVALALALALGLWPAAAGAHPHVWVKVSSTVLYDKGSIVGLEHAWTFDELFASDATQGLDVNGDGTLDRAELADLAKENVEGMKELGYFTFARLGTQMLSFKDPTDYFLELKENVLTLHFTLPFSTPILAEASGFAFNVTDESYFIAFEFMEGTPVTLGPGAPSGCSIAMVEPPEEELALADAFNEALTEPGAAEGTDSGAAAANAPPAPPPGLAGRAVAVDCKS